MCPSFLTCFQGLGFQWKRLKCLWSCAQQFFHALWCHVKRTGQFLTHHSWGLSSRILHFQSNCTETTKHVYTEMPSCKGHCFLTLLSKPGPASRMATGSKYLLHESCESFYFTVYIISYFVVITFSFRGQILFWKEYFTKLILTHVIFSSTSYWFKIEEEVNRKDLHWIRMGDF